MAAGKPAPKRKKEHVELGWVTVTYRSVFLSILGLLIVAGIVAYFFFPGPVKGFLNAALAKSGLADAPKANKRAAGDQKASFTMIDGTKNGENPCRVPFSRQASWVRSIDAIPPSPAPT